MTTAKPVSLADLDARTASDAPFEFEYILPDGSASGVKFKVLGANSAVVDAAINANINAGRRRAIAAAAQSRPGKTPEITPIEDDVAESQKLAAIRLVGWNLSDPFTPENALRLIQQNAHASQQIVEASNNLGNFLRKSR